MDVRRDRGRGWRDEYRERHEPDRANNNAWANSVLSDAFPNDAAAVVAGGGGGRSAVDSFSVVVNKNFPDPVLTPFLPFGIHNIVAADSRIVILREAAKAIAYQVGNFPGKANVPFIAAWEFGKARTLTTGDVCGASSFFSYPTWTGWNDYIPDMFVNLVFYATRRTLIEDVQVYHQLRSRFLETRTRLGILISLIDFIEKFGVNSKSVNDDIIELREIIHDAEDLYLEGDFIACQDAMNTISDRFTGVENSARRLKNRALAWVYAIEWFVTMGTLMISSVILWSVMVRSGPAKPI